MNKIIFSTILILYFIIFSAFSGNNNITSLKNERITKVSLRCDTSLIVPGSLHKIGLVVQTNEGNILQTKGLLDGTLKWSNFSIETDKAKFFQGYLNISKIKVNERIDYIPFRITVKNEYSQVFFDTLWLNYEKQIELFPMNDYRLVPGAKVKFGMNVTYDNDRTLIYKSSSAMKKVLPSYQVLVKGGKHDDGEFIISSDIFEYPDHTPGFLVQLIKDTTVFDIFDIQLDYKERYSYNGFGSSGMFGSSGFSGSSGSTGQHGQPGQDGDHGSYGYPGDDIDIYADVYFDSILNQNLMRVFIDNITRKKQQYYLVNTVGGSVSINASGGNGGKGGSGGNGGNGGKGFTGEYYFETIKEIIIKKDTAGKETRVEITKQIQRQRRGGDGGFGGPGGYGGIGGEGGQGGHIMLFYTLSAKNYLNLIEIVTTGGSGSWGGSGGSGGRGGDGGDGNPKGRSGGHGTNGLDGPRGYDGRDGKVELKEIDKIPW